MIVLDWKKDTGMPLFETLSKLCQRGRPLALVARK
jgi:hypothetical protein